MNKYFYGNGEESSDNSIEEEVARGPPPPEANLARRPTPPESDLVWRPPQPAAYLVWRPPPPEVDHAWGPPPPELEAARARCLSPPESGPTPETEAARGPTSPEADLARGPPPPESFPARPAARRVMCHPFVRGECPYGDACPNTHEIIPNQMEDVYTFCGDYANNDCDTQQCKLAHASDSEQRIFHRTGYLPPHSTIHFESAHTPSASEQQQDSARSEYWNMLRRWGANHGSEHDEELGAGPPPQPPPGVGANYLDGYEFADGARRFSNNAWDVAARELIERPVAGLAWPGAIPAPSGPLPAWPGAVPAPNGPLLAWPGAVPAPSGPLPARPGAVPAPPGARPALPGTDPQLERCAHCDTYAFKRRALEQVQRRNAELDRKIAAERERVAVASAVVLAMLREQHAPGPQGPRYGVHPLPEDPRERQAKIEQAERFLAARGLTLSALTEGPSEPLPDVMARLMLERTRKQLPPPPPAAE